MHQIGKALWDICLIVGGAVVSTAQVIGPVVSVLAGVVSIVWGSTSLYFLLKRELAKKK